MDKEEENSVRLAKKKGGSNFPIMRKPENRKEKRLPPKAKIYRPLRSSERGRVKKSPQGRALHDYPMRMAQPWSHAQATMVDPAGLSLYV